MSGKCIFRILAIVFCFLSIACNRQEGNVVNDAPVRAVKAPASKSKVTKHIRAVFDYSEGFTPFSSDTFPLFSRLYLKTFYENRNFEPIWVQKNKVSDIATEALTILLKANEYGLLPRDYDSEKLQKAFAELKGKVSSDREVPYASLDIKLTSSIMLFICHINGGRINPSTLKPVREIRDTIVNPAQVLTEAMNSENFSKSILDCQPQHKVYRDLIKALSDFKTRFPKMETNEPVPDLKGDTSEFYNHLVNALKIKGFLGDYNDTLSYKERYNKINSSLKKFQAQHGLKPDGKMGTNTLNALNVPLCERYRQILINIERCRWDLPFYSEDYLFINIPSYQLQVFREKKKYKTFKVVVGLPDHQTPVLTSVVRNFITSPEWHVPYSISTKELLPLIKKNPSYLEQKNYVLFDRKNNPVDPYTVDWDKITEANFKYYIRQASGDDNSLGIIKFNFLNKYSVYLHDTPYKTLFEKDLRAFSHGCVRVENPVDLAVYLLERDSSDYTPQKLKKVIDSGKTTVFALKKKIPIYIRYYTCTASNGLLCFFEDIYNKDPELKKVFFKSY